MGGCLREMISDVIVVLAVGAAAIAAGYHIGYNIGYEKGRSEERIHHECTENESLQRDQKIIQERLTTSQESERRGE